MPPTTAMSGTKRPVTSVEEGSEDGKDSAAVLSRPSQQPRLEESGASGTGSDQGNNDDTCIGCNIDLICQIASFMNTGKGLTNVCVAVGSEDATKIRHDYLLDNDDYIVASLKKLAISGLPTSWEAFDDNLHLFEKSKQRIIAWMKVNKNWTKRCTDANMEKYKCDVTIPLDEQELQTDEANLVFNNPAVAIELGLIDVLRFLVEKKEIDVNANLWNGFNSDIRPSNDHLVKLALVRGDTALLRYILSVDGFDMSKMIDEDGDNEGGWIFHFAMGTHGDRMKAECVEILLRHPNVNLNITYDEGQLTPLLAALENLTFAIRDENEGSVQRLMKCIDAILDAGGDPQYEVGGVSPISLVQSRLENSEGQEAKVVWEDVAEKLGLSE